jgi:cation transport regulator
MAQKKSKSSTYKPTGKSSALSSRTKKQIDSLPQHAQEIYKEAHANALKQYQNPAKRRGGKKQSAEQVAHKTAWAAVKRKYEKQEDMWAEK